MSVTAARRAFLAAEWRDTVATDSTVQTAHPLSQPVIIETLMTSATDATSEAARVLSLRSVKRDRYEVVLQLNSETNALDLGDVIGVSHPRFGLSLVGDDTNRGAGLFRIIDIAPNAGAQEIRLGLWGKVVSRNIVSDSSTGGLYLVSDTGVYAVSSDP